MTPQIFTEEILMLSENHSDDAEFGAHVRRITHEFLLAKMDDQTIDIFEMFRLDGSEDDCAGGACKL